MQNLKLKPVPCTVYSVAQTWSDLKSISFLMFSSAAFLQSGHTAPSIVSLLNSRFCSLPSGLHELQSHLAVLSLHCSFSQPTGPMCWTRCLLWPLIRGWQLQTCPPSPCVALAPPWACWPHPVSKSLSGEFLLHKQLQSTILDVWTPSSASQHHNAKCWQNGVLYL